METYILQHLLEGDFKFQISLYITLEFLHFFRLFQILFLVVGLAMFTTVIPEAMMLGMILIVKLELILHLTLKMRF